MDLQPPLHADSSVERASASTSSIPPLQPDTKTQDLTAEKPIDKIIECLERFHNLDEGNCDTIPSHFYDPFHVPESDYKCFMEKMNTEAAREESLALFFFLRDIVCGIYAEIGLLYIN